MFKGSPLLRHISTAVLALASLRQLANHDHVDALFAAFARELRGKFRKCSLREAAITANAFARLRFEHQLLFAQGFCKGFLVVCFITHKQQIFVSDISGIYYLDSAAMGILSSEMETNPLFLTHYYRSDFASQKILVIY